MVDVFRYVLLLFVIPQRYDYFLTWQKLFFIGGNNLQRYEIFPILPNKVIHILRSSFSSRKLDLNNIIKQPAPDSAPRGSLQPVLLIFRQSKDTMYL
jgi:hypothetical protein